VGGVEVGLLLAVALRKARLFMKMVEKRKEFDVCIACCVGGSAPGLSVP